MFVDMNEFVDYVCSLVVCDSLVSSPVNFFVRHCKCITGASYRLIPHVLLFCVGQLEDGLQVMHCCDQ